MAKADWRLVDSGEEITFKITEGIETESVTSTSEVTTQDFSYDLSLGISFAFPAKTILAIMGLDPLEAAGNIEKNW